MKRAYGKNTRKLIYPVGPSIAYVPLTKGYFACIDLLDAERVANHNWWANKLNKIYAARSIYRGRGTNSTSESLQAFILGHVDGFTVDHVSSKNVLDNRRANLRHATKTQQSYNRGVFKNSVSGIKGVRYHNHARMWQARITFDGKQISLGFFLAKEEAQSAYIAAVKIHHKEYGRNQ